MTVNGYFSEGSEQFQTGALSFLLFCAIVVLPNQGVHYKGGGETILEALAWEKMLSSRVIIEEEYKESRPRKLTAAAKSLGIRISVLKVLASDGKLILTDEGLLSGSSFILLKAIILSVRERYSTREEASEIVGEKLFCCIEQQETIPRKKILGIEFYRSWELRQFKHAFEDFILEASGWIERRELPLRDWFFAYTHLLGCNGNELVVQMGKFGRNSDLSYGITVSKQIKASRIGRQWRIDQHEIVRVLDIHRNRIGLRQVAIEKGYSRYTLASYGREGLLGDIKPNLSGADSILRSVYDQLDELIPKIARQKELSRVSWGTKKLKKSELSPNSIHRKYKKFGLESGIIKYWTAEKMLPSKKQGKFRIILFDDFKSFAILTANGENKIRSKYRKIFTAICKKEGWT